MKWAFVSDFDGTITRQDFYWKIINESYPEGKVLYKKWKAGELKDIDFLAHIFTSINKDEIEIKKMVHSLSIDKSVLTFIQEVQKNGGNFYILSAGTDYYIEEFIKHYDIRNVEVFSNEGYFYDKNIHLTNNNTNEFYSKRYGIDKAKVIQHLKRKYDTVYFIGDGEPDTHAAEFADVTFAKGDLQSLLKDRNIPFHSVESFNEVSKNMIEIKK